MGHIVYFSLEAFNQSTTYTHTNGIRQIFLDSNGTQLCFIDDKGDVYLYDPLKENVAQVPDRPENAEGVVWEQYLYERHIFLVYNKTIVTTYAFVKFHIEGKSKSAHTFAMFFINCQFHNFQAAKSLKLE